ncbi:hypothetical protein N7495_000357 [Penicillium taxi]|uniref:uncharacterized protein n=1 Tax=Penicillium taxi TaxID=168475 RepID=UPI00254574BA|nr:uncharacterized protein N7495_000357 [Penicillium taxi]KAJ5907675.1 hypothetical protein N7495_000357 [Penicillium taxi]
MPICIECSYPVSHLYSAYSRADDRSQGKGVRLTQCPRCQRFADKYVEYDFVVIFIDLVLIKPQVTKLTRWGDQRSIIRLGILLLLFDVYLTWARLEKDPSLATTFIARAPIVVQYLFFLTLNAAATLAHHLTVRLLARFLVPKSHRYSAPETPATSNVTSTANMTDTTPLRSGPSTPISRPSPQCQPVNSLLGQQTNIGAPQMKVIPNPGSSADVIATASSPREPSPNSQSATAPPQRSIPPLKRTSTAPLQNIQPLPPPTAASPTAISTALLVSSCAKMFPILLVIWGSDRTGNSANNQSGNRIEQIAGMSQGLYRSSKAGYPSTHGAEVLSSFREVWLATPESWLRPYLSASYLSWLFDLLASLISLGVVDTHLALLSNIEALYILLGCGYLRSVAVAVAGQIARWGVQKVVLGAVGVGT